MNKAFGVRLWKHPDGLSSANLLVLQLCLMLAILFHIPEGGQGGRPTLFQLCIFTMIGMSVFNPRLVRLGSATETMIRMLVLFCITIILSWSFGFGFATVSAERLSSDLSAVGSYMKVLSLAIFSVSACGTGLYLGLMMKGNVINIRRILWVIVVASTINGVAVIIAWIVQTGGVLDRYNFILPLFKSYGLSATASYTALMLIFPLWHENRSIASRSFLAVAGLICTASCVVILSRQTIATLFALLILYGLIANRNRGINWKTALALAALSTGLIIFFTKTIGFNELFGWYDRLQDRSDSSISGRENAIAGSIAIFREHPVLGVGYGFWFVFNKITFAVVGDETVVVASPHNGAASILSECGSIGTIAYILLNISMIRAVWRASKVPSSPTTMELANVTAALLVIHVISQLTSNSVILPVSAEASSVQYAFIVWLLVGMCGGIEGKTKAQYKMGTSGRRKVGSDWIALQKK